MLTSVRDLVEMAVLAALVAMAGWAVWRLQRSGRLGWRVRALVGLLSLALGVGLCFLPYRAHSGMLRGFPLPLVIQVKGGSAGSVPSPLGMGLAATLNLVLVAGVMHALTGLVFGWARRHDRSRAPRRRFR